MVTLVIPGILSFKYTEKMISCFEKPIASAASIRPLSTSESTDSICLAKKGTVPNTKATNDP